MSPEATFQKQIYEFLMESQFWAHSQLLEYQRGQLSQMLRFAYAKVPFYQQRLKPVMRADGEIDWGRWHEIPILKRQDLVDHREAMLATELPPGHGNWSDHKGSGSTGVPVITRHNMLTALASQAASFRAHTWYKTDFRKNVFNHRGDDRSKAIWPEGANLGPWGPSWMPESQEGSFLTLNKEASPEMIAEFIVRKNVSYLTGWPIEALAVALASDAAKTKHRIDAIYTHGTPISEKMREDFRAIFGAEAYSLYASKEVYNIAHQCPSSTRFHINPELLLLEVLDDNGSPCPPGVSGRAIISQFFNTAQPFIRYELGDQIVLGETCTCGLMLPVIERVEGRLVHMFRFPGRKPIAFAMGPKMMDVIAASAWQIAQVAPLAIEVRYIPVGGGKPDFERFTEIIRARFDPRLEVTYKRVDVLPLAPSGKFIEYVCELPPEA